MRVPLVQRLPRPIRFGEERLVTTWAAPASQFGVRPPVDSNHTASLYGLGDLSRASGRSIPRPHPNLAVTAPLRSASGRSRSPLLTAGGPTETNQQADSRSAVHQGKTAGVHVSHILAKLGVTKRGEAAAVSHRLGPSEVS